MLDRAILLILAVEYGTLLGYYALTGSGTKALYWLGALLLQIAVMKGLQ